MSLSGTENPKVINLKKMIDRIDSRLNNSDFNMNYIPYDYNSHNKVNNKIYFSPNMREKVTNMSHCELNENNYSYHQPSHSYSNLLSKNKDYNDLNSNYKSKS